MSVLSQEGENIEVNKATGTWDSTITEALLTFRSLLAMYRKKYHDFSLVKKYGISVYTLRPYRQICPVFPWTVKNIHNF